MLKTTVRAILEERKKIHDNDPAVQSSWDKLILELSKDEQQTIDFMNQCNEEEVSYISEVFEDISLNLKSKKFVDTLKLLLIKFPDSHLEYSIEIAEIYSRL